MTWSGERLLVALVALAPVGPGLWATAAPESFYATLAVYPPYNRHLVHDFGAFMLGLGTTFGFALAGNAVGALAHFVSHAVDRDLGGQPGDPLVVGAFALVLVGLVVWRARTIGLTRR